jgi:hypothetical protein
LTKRSSLEVVIGGLRMRVSVAIASLHLAWFRKFPVVPISAHAVAKTLCMIRTLPSSIFNFIRRAVKYDIPKQRLGCAQHKKCKKKKTLLTDF